MYGSYRLTVVVAGGSTAYSVYEVSDRCVCGGAWYGAPARILT